MLSASSFELDWSDVDVIEEPAPATSKASSSDARAVQPSPRDLAPPPTAPAAIVGHPPAPAASAPIIGYPPGARREPELSSPPPAASTPAPAPIPSADVVPLEELDFGESPFAAPPRPLVQPPPEPEPVDLPMLEAEEEIELTPAAELTPGPDAGPRLGDAKAEPSSVRPSVPKPLPADAGWTVAPAAPDLIPAPGATALQPSAAAVPADGGEAQLREALSRASREVIERIAWEVVPQLAETIIREQIDRLAKDRQR